MTPEDQIPLNTPHDTSALVTLAPTSLDLAAPSAGRVD
jgi:hypothetical protein